MTDVKIRENVYCNALPQFLDLKNLQTIFFPAAVVKIGVFSVWNGVILRILNKNDYPNWSFTTPSHLNDLIGNTA